MATTDDKPYEVGYCKPPREQQFKKGQSGNPGGRAKVMSAAYREVAAGVEPNDDRGRTRAQLMALALYNKAKAGDVAAIKEFADRLEGKARQTIALTDDRREQLEQMIEQMLEDAVGMGEELTRAQVIALLRPTTPEMEYLN